MGASGRCGGLAGTIERVAAYGARARHAVVVLYALRAMQVNRVRVTIARNANRKRKRHLFGFTCPVGYGVE